MVRYFFTFSLILLAVLSRLLPHPPNVTPITALALFGGVYLDKKHTFIMPIAAMLISDYFLGFYSGIAWVYASFILIGVIGLWLRKHQRLIATIGASIVGSVLFFIITNFGVWISPQFSYPHTLIGLLQCYIAAIPFFRNALVGDLFYLGILFGLYEFGKKYIRVLKPLTESIQI